MGEECSPALQGVKGLIKSTLEFEGFQGKPTQPTASISGKDGKGWAFRTEKNHSIRSNVKKTSKDH